ncbi:MAG: helix-turn-helix transcriptional regulator [Actinobacteria bacterium]|nr:MAG: helix-turn-helix transcriptional regulator [Actinomycetota bacterium]
MPGTARVWANSPVGCGCSGQCRSSRRPTYLPLAVLAVEAGFCDQSHFTRAFRRLYGVTPARFRAMHR